ncbi:MAG: phosphatase PAP2 family protein [Chloroflexi bacterium]|nr:MAG: phosphatase PAP2 family protein [Chloroflexota bacterium]
MLTHLEAGIGLDVVVWLQAHGNVVFDSVAQFLHVIGQVPGHVVGILLVFIGLDRRLALRMAIMLIVVIVVIVGAKEILERPRPYQAFPDEVTPLVEQDGFGIPSGHVGFAVVTWGLLALHLRRRVWIAVWLIYVALQFWARMYLGVHYPQDVVAGLLMGAVVLWIGCAGWTRVFHQLRTNPV